LNALPPINSLMIDLEGTAVGGIGAKLFKKFKR
jgi:hypothetical protein